MILADLVDQAVCRFKHGGDLGDFWHLLELSELISSHGQVGAWSLVDIVAIDMNEFVIEVAAEWAGLPCESSCSLVRAVTPLVLRARLALRLRPKK